MELPERQCTQCFVRPTNSPVECIIFFGNVQVILGEYLNSTAPGMF
jgi:hypothetical protein